MATPYQERKLRDPAVNPGTSLTSTPLPKASSCSRNAALAASTTTTRAVSARSASATRLSGCRRRARARYIPSASRAAAGPLPIASLRHSGEGVRMMNQHRRLRSRYDPDRTESEGRLQKDRRRRVNAMFAPPPHPKGFECASPANPRPFADPVFGAPMFSSPVPIW